jgi:hypothetical protein
MDESRINDIISQYPYPIAILYRIVAGLDLKEEPGKGVEYILQTAESTARLMGMMAVAELALLKEKNGVEMPNSVKTDFKKHLKRPSFGIWLGIAREGFAFLDDSGAEPVMPELKTLFYEDKKETDFKTAMDKLVKLRNAIAHRKVVLDSQDKQQSAANISLNYLHTALMRLEFLKDVSFGYIKSIEVNKKPRRNPEFLHKGKNLKGDSIGKGINLSSVFSDFKETDTVIIRYDADSYLNLYPLYIYDESSGDAADVFFYNGMDRNRLEYIGIDPGGKFFVENKEPEDGLDVDEEFDLLMAGSGRKIDKENVRFSTELHEEFDYITGLLG